MLLGLAAVWGPSFVLIEIALREVSPAWLVTWRFAFGLAAVLPVVVRAVGLRGFAAALRKLGARLALVAALSSAVPFYGIAWGQQWIPSGLTAILVSAAPLFTAVLAFLYVPSERVAGARLAGIGLGFAGVVLLLAVSPAFGDRALAGAAAVVAAALGYAAGGLYIAARLRGEQPLVLAAGVMLWSLVLAAPAAALAPSAPLPGAATILALAALGAVATGLAYWLFLAILLSTGASRAILVTYLVPGMAVAYGVALLGEPLTLRVVAGLVLILAGVTLATGAIARLGRSYSARGGRPSPPR
jgi:drug/metabolite transporter (DMT)-like permease